MFFFYLQFCKVNIKKSQPGGSFELLSESIWHQSFYSLSTLINLYYFLKQMDPFLHEDCTFETNFFQNNHQNEVEVRSQEDNIFGVNFKENMFEDPCIIHSNFPQEKNEETLFHMNEQECMSSFSTQTPAPVKAPQFPPCRCYRIHCQKKYCECFRSGRKCTKKCICVDCHNQPVVTKMRVNVEQFWQVSYMFNSIMKRN